MRIGILALAVMGAILSVSPSGAQSGGNPKRGKVYAQQLCADCHAIDDVAAVSPNKAALPFSRAANTSGMTAIALSAWLQTIHPTMPNIMLNTDTADDIIAYIVSLRVHAH